MQNKRNTHLNEIITILIAAIVLTISINLFRDISKEFNIYLSVFLSLFIIIALNILAKEFIAYLLDSELEIKFWELKKGSSPKKQGKITSFPLGIFAPLLSRFLLFAFGNFIWMASLIFDVKPKVYRSAKRYGLYSFSEMSEYHIGLIAASGILINLVSSAIFYIFGNELAARLSLYYCFFNLIPISELDGNKIFYGKRELWIILSIIVSIGLLFCVFTM